MTTTMVRGKREVTFVSQQYAVGLYVAVYEPLNAVPKEQLSLQCTDAQFHTDLRAGKVMKRGWRAKV